MTTMATDHPIIQIFNRWGTRRALFEDAQAADPKLDMIAVHRWFQRKSLPPKYDAALLEGAEKRGFGLHPMELVRARATHTDRIGHTSRARQDSPAQKDKPEGVQ